MAELEREFKMFVLIGGSDRVPEGWERITPAPPPGGVEFQIIAGTVRVRLAV